MRIAIVAPTYPPDDESGVAALARREATALAALGHDVRVVAGTRWRRAGGREVVEGTVDGIPVRWIPRDDEEVDADRPASPRWTKLVLEAVRGADGAHVHHGATLAEDLVRCISRRMPCLLTLHGDAERIAAPSPATAHPLAARLAATRREEFAKEVVAADALLVAGERRREALLAALREHHGEQFGERFGERLRLHDPGTTMRRASGVLAGERRAWRGNGPLSVISFGRRSAESGLHDLLRALRARGRSRVELVLCGPAAAGIDEDLRRAAGDELSLHLFGAYDEKQLATLAVACDLAAFPARGGAFDERHVDEALALGLPVWLTAFADARGRCRPRGEEPTPGRVIADGETDSWTRAFDDLFAAPAQHERERSAARALRLPSCAEATGEIAALLAGLVAGAPLPASAPSAAHAAEARRLLAS